MSRRSGLGRGLGALIPSELVSGEHDSFRDLPLSSIEPNRYQPREHFDEAALVALSQSIRELGVLQPILVRAMEDDRYELIAGERRWRAARKAGLSTIPAIIRTVDDNASLEQALVENLHRADLNALEEAAAYQQLMEDFGHTQEQVAARVGKSRSAVANTLRLLQLPVSAQRLLAEGRLTAGHARALLGTPDRSLQEQLARQVVAESWTVRQVEDAVRAQAWEHQVEEHLAATATGAPPPPAAATTGTDLASSPRAAVQPAPTSERTGGPGSSGLPSAAIGAPSSVAAVPQAGAPATGAVLERPKVVPQPERTLPPAGLLELEQLLGDYFDTTVRISAGKGRGRLTIDFADVADLERIYRLIVDES